MKGWGGMGHGQGVEWIGIAFPRENECRIEAWNVRQNSPLHRRVLLCKVVRAAMLSLDPPSRNDYLGWAWTRHVCWASGVL